MGHFVDGNPGALPAVRAIQAQWPNAAGAGTTATTALCWEATARELRRWRPVQRLVMAARPWRCQDWPLPKRGKAGPDTERMCAMAEVEESRRYKCKSL